MQIYFHEYVHKVLSMIFWSKSIHASTTDVHLQVSEDGETLQPFIICVGVMFSFIK